MTGRFGAMQARLERFMREDRWIPWTFVAGFIVLIAVNGVLVVRAVESWPGVESANAYEEGLAYNRTLEEARRQKALGWRYAFAFTPAGERTGRIEVSLHDRHGVALSQAEVDARLVRPTSEGHDFEVGLVPQGDGRFAADVTMPLPGLWEVRIDAVHPAGTYRDVERVVVR